MRLEGLSQEGCERSSEGNERAGTGAAIEIVRYHTFSQTGATPP